MRLLWKGSGRWPFTKSRRTICILADARTQVRGDCHFDPDLRALLTWRSLSENPNKSRLHIHLRPFDTDKQTMAFACS